ncbi:MAG TPA: thioredoxin family protein [Acidobacteriota bacterium]|nr:thioredoxin family protein [Acidobacteriota bacterium]
MGLKRGITAGLMVSACWFWVSVGLGAAEAVDYDNFLRIGKFEVVVDGQVDGQARLYHSMSPPAFLIMVPVLEEAIVLLPGRSEVASVSKDHVEADEDRAAIASQADLRTVGDFTVGSGQTVDLKVDGRAVGLRPKSDLVGEVSSQDLKNYDPLYRIRSREYQPDPNFVRILKTYQGKAQVRVFFGSWCQFCQANVPKMIKLEEQLADTGISFSYYGLPHGFNSEPVAIEANVKQVPTAIVTVDGKEVGRIIGTDTQNPAGNLHRVLMR